jgi:hypothetical protein
MEFVSLRVGNMLLKGDYYTTVTIWINSENVQIRLFVDVSVV